MTAKQREVLFEVWRVGVTLGFSDLYGCLLAYESYCSPSLFSPKVDTDLMLRDAYEAVAAFLRECGPPGGLPNTVATVGEQVVAYQNRCCFPGCYGEGEHRVVNLESTNMKLCGVHRGCLRGPHRDH